MNADPRAAGPEPEPEPPSLGERGQVQLPTWPPHFNLAACGCVGCYVADADASWILSCAPCGTNPAMQATHVSLAKGEDNISLSAGSSCMKLAYASAGGRRKNSGIDLELDSLGTLTAVNRRATEPMVVYLTVVLPVAIEKVTGERDKAAAVSHELAVAVGDFKRVHPEMGVKKLSAAFKKEHPDLPGIGAKEIRAALAASTLDANAGTLHFEGRGGQALLLGKTRPHDGAQWDDALTMIITVTPGEELRLATVSGGLNGPPASIQTFVFPLTVHPNRSLATTDDMKSIVRFTHWPLPPAACPALCTQGVGGRLTHFFPESYHAIDLRCDDGTVLLAVADGVVVAVEAKKSASGISSANLVKWNALTLALDTPGPTGEVILVDYVHIRANSALAAPGT